jgi:hypothetical protein
MKIDLITILKLIHNDISDKDMVELAKFALDYSKTSDTVFKIEKLAKEAADSERD